MKFQDPDFVLHCAFRYTLGRQTYAVSAMVDEILHSWKHINGFTIDKIVKEIKQADSRDELGDKIDKKEWMKIVKRYEEEQK